MDGNDDKPVCLAINPDNNQDDDFLQRKNKKQKTKLKYHKKLASPQNKCDF